MPSVSCFSLPLAEWQQPPDHRRAYYHQHKKRKIEEQTEELDRSGDDDDFNSVGDEAGSSHRSFSSSGKPFAYATLSPNIAATLEDDAEDEEEDEYFSRHFPHTPRKKTRKRTAVREDVQTELQNLRPPMFLQPSSNFASHTRQSLGVLTAILHDSLLKSNFHQAGKVWARILSTQIGGRPTDIRSQGRWGIGAEILLKQGTMLPSPSDERSEESPSESAHEETEGESADERPLLFTRNGFEKAKAYYERLILQYPFNKQNPLAPNALDFYPAMFGLWIYTIQQEMDASLHRIEKEDADDTTSERMDDTSETIRRKTEERENVRQAALQQAEEIASRIDELLLGPPYSESGVLLRLRGMISLWVGDLHVAQVPKDDHEHPESTWGEASPSEGLETDDTRQRERRSEHIEKAKYFFGKATDRGEHVNLENLEEPDSV